MIVTIPGITDGTGTVLGAPERNYSEIGKMDFMQLLVAQIQNQDPLSPMDNAEFTSQITEFTMLEEMEGINAKLEENLLIGQSINNTSMLNLVGKKVTVEGDAAWCEDGVISESIVISDGPGVAIVEVKDSSGQVVATYQKTVIKGLNTVSWDGRLADGGMAEDGEYSLAVNVTNGDLALNSTTLMTGPVEGIRFDNNVAVVLIGGQEFYVSEVYKVS